MVPVLGLTKALKAYSWRIASRDRAWLDWALTWGAEKHRRRRRRSRRRWSLMENNNNKVVSCWYVLGYIENNGYGIKKEQYSKAATLNWTVAWEKARAAALWNLVLLLQNMAAEEDELKALNHLWIWESIIHSVAFWLGLGSWFMTWFDLLFTIYLFDWAIEERVKL